MFFKWKLRRHCLPRCVKGRRDIFPDRPVLPQHFCAASPWTSPSSVQKCFYTGTVASSLPIFLHKARQRHGTRSFAPWRPVFTLHLQLTTPVQPVPLCSRNGVAHHQAYTKNWCLVHRWSSTASAHKHTEGWDTPKQSGITVLRNSYSLLLVLVKSKRDA